MECPVYDYAIHDRVEETRTVRPKPIIIVEGILIFAEQEILDLLDIKNALEESFRLCDLLYGYCEKFGHTEFREEIMDRKNLISEQMSSILARQSLSGKKCPGCGRGMPWNYPYRLCENCFRRQRQGRWRGKGGIL